MAKVYELQDGIPFSHMSYNEQQIILYLEEMNEMEKDNNTGCTYHVEVKEITKSDTEVLLRYRVYMEHHDPTGKHTATVHLTDYAPCDRIRLICFALHATIRFHHHHT